MQNNEYKSGFVAILGRPNVGKSTLMNALIGEKVAIVSKKAQTTRNRIMGVLTGEGFQAVFLDTPGIHKPRTALGTNMMKAVDSALVDTEILVFVVDVSDIRAADQEIIDKYSARKAKKLLILNKIDRVSKEELALAIERFSKYDVQELVPISALTGDGVDVVKDLIKKHLPKGPQYFPENYITDMPERFIVAEMIREKALMHLDEEIPHGIGVEIMEIKKAPSGVTHIQATIYCEKNSHKSIIIGKGGSMIGKIGSAARYEIERLLDGQINLQLWVKVVPDWRNRASELKNLGYVGD
ncbi:MAG: GTPase Era [Christensenellales bacterium]|jgi:GTP-binding protein Era